MGATEALLQPKKLRTDDHTIGYVTAGRSAGITFVLVHTIGTSSRSFTPLIARLAEHFRVIAVDLPGFGTSSRTIDTLSMQDFAEEIRAVIKHERALQPILVGHGMGSQVVASLLATYPEITAKAILIGPTVAPKQRSMAVHYLKVMQDICSEPPRAALSIWREYLTGNPLQYFKTLPAMLRNRIDGNVAGCQAAVMIIRGEHDVIVPHAWAGKLAAIATVAGVFEIKGAPHHVHLTNTAEVADICEGFAFSQASPSGTISLHA